MMFINMNFLIFIWYNITIFNYISLYFSFSEFKLMLNLNHNPEIKREYYNLIISKNL